MNHSATGSAQKVFQGVRFDVHAVELPGAGGRSHRREYVQPADAVAILPVLEDGGVVLIRNQRFAVGKTLYEIPAGTLEAGEDPQACAGRELLEETGYRARQLDELTGFYTSPGFCTERMIAYTARGLSFQGQELDETERIAVEPVSWDELLAMTRDGRIEDGKTLAVVLYYAMFKGPRPRGNG